MGTKIRDKFIEHMEFTGLAKQTQRSYITGVKGLANQGMYTKTSAGFCGVPEFHMAAEDLGHASMIFVTLTPYTA